jgi:hypothetical protein
VDPSSLAALTGCLVVAGVCTLLAFAYSLVRAKQRSSLSGGEQAALLSKRSEPAEKTDALAALRSPYKPTPLCGQCLTMRHPGGGTYFVCRMNDRCGLHEDEKAC